MALMLSAERLSTYAPEDLEDSPSGGLPRNMLLILHKTAEQVVMEHGTFGGDPAKSYATILSLLYHKTLAEHRKRSGA